jgi:hypothetical protein
MKKFKLIKQYPGSPKLGTIVTKTCGWYTEGPGSTTYDQHLIENDPEYWQEIKQGNYQIISFFYNGWDGKIATLNEKGNYSTSYEKRGWTLHEMLNVGASVKSGQIKIHSVKRLSDGEIFTLGDRAKTITSKGSHDITQFKIKQRCTGTDANGNYTYDGIEAMWINWEKDCGGNWLDSTEKVKQPIFTTEDGVGIREGDTYYFVDTDFSIQTMKALRGAGQYSERKYFSTAEEAHEYVMQNVKALSIKDFWEITCMSTSNFNKSTYMRDLVKKTLGIK